MLLHYTNVVDPATAYFNNFAMHQGLDKLGSKLHAINFIVISRVKGRWRHQWRCSAHVNVLTLRYNAPCNILVIRVILRLIPDRSIPGRAIRACSTHERILITLHI